MRTVEVREVMTSPVVTIDASATLHHAAEVLAEAGISGAPVLKEGEVVGMLSEADIIMASRPPASVESGLLAGDLLSLFLKGTLKPRDLSKRVETVMTHGAVVIRPNDTLWKAADLIQRHGVKRLPVIEDGKLIGIVSRTDLIAYLGRSDEQIAEDVRRAVMDLGVDEIYGLKVRCTEGVVAIGGVADRSSTRRLATRIAASVPGVVGVRDHLEHEWDDSEVSKTPRRSPWNETRKI